MGLQPEDVWRILADHGPSTAEHLAVHTGSTPDGVVGYLREDQHYERVTASKAPDGTYVYALLPAGGEALHRAESFSLMLDLLDDAVQSSQPWAIAEGLGEGLELVAGLIARGVQGEWVMVAEDGGAVITDRGRRKLEVDRAVGRLTPSL